MSGHVKNAKEDVLKYYRTVPLEELEKDLGEFIKDLNLSMYHYETIEITEIRMDKMDKMDSFSMPLAHAS